MKWSLFSWLILTILSATATASKAEKMGAGTYNGYYNETRWGDKVLHLGPYHTFLGETAAEALHKHKGKPLEVEVSDLSQPINPGAGLIQTVGKVKEHSSDEKLRIEAELEAEEVERGDGISVKVRLKNDSDKGIIIGSATLAIVLVANSTHNESEIDYEDPDDRSYWYYRYGYRSFDGETKPKSIACHQILLKWSDENFSGIEVDPSRNRVTKGDPISVEANGTFTAKYRGAKELPEGEYEMFVYVTSGNLSSEPGPMSARLPFDVVAKQVP